MNACAGVRSIKGLHCIFYEYTRLRSSMQIQLAWPRYAHSGEKNALATSFCSTKLRLKQRRKHKGNIAHTVLPENKIQEQCGGSNWKTRQPLCPSSDDGEQQISGSQWTQPECLSAWRWEGSPLLPVTSSHCSPQLTTQCRFATPTPVHACKCSLCVLKLDSCSAQHSAQQTAGAGIPEVVVALVPLGPHL